MFLRNEKESKCTIEESKINLGKSGISVVLFANVFHMQG